MEPDASPKIFLITGATRGIGLALVKCIISSDSSAIVYAAGRDPYGSPQLVEAAANCSNRVELVKYVAGDKDGNEMLQSIIEKKYGRLDVVIANAGINTYLASVHKTSADKFEEHFSINTLGAVLLFQTMRALLKASLKPRFIAISSMVASIGLLSDMANLDIAAYGSSKATLNWIMRKIHFENDWLVAFPICPGPVYTDMAKNAIASHQGSGVDEHFDGSWRTPDIAAGMLFSVISESERDKDGGEFHSVEGARYPW